MWFVLLWGFYVFREDGVAVLTPSDEDVALEVTVTNKGGDDAHQPHCVIHLPDSLRYSSVVHSTTAVSVQQLCGGGTTC